jgi:hypothetical protein
MKKFAELLMFVLMTLAYVASVAAGGSHAGAGAGAGAGASAGAGHLSASGQANTNGRYAADRDTGLDRAQDRMSEQGLAHEKASAAAGQRKGQDAVPATPRASRTFKPKAGAATN